MRIPLAAALWLTLTSAAAQAQDLTAIHSDDATEDTTGVFVRVNPMIVGSPLVHSPFGEARLLMRPFSLSAGSANTVSLTATTIYGDEGMLAVFREDGTRIDLPALFPAASLPSTILVSATSTGEALLALRPTHTTVGASLGDEVLVRVGPFPGLAGNAVASYPFFEYPKAFNDNRDVQCALDPLRHAEREGLSYDIYVVPARTASQWAQNPVLADVTAAIETATVNGSSIQTNVTTAYAAPLDSDAGRGLGVPYDMVCDFDQNGRLDPGDIIDAFTGNEAGLYAVKDTTLDGPLSVGSFTFNDNDLFLVEGFDGGSTRTLRSRGLVLYPDPLPEGKLPLVTFSHGNTGISNSYRGYRYLQRLLASHGFITASFDMFPAHVSLGIRWRGWLTNKNTERLILQTALNDDNGNPYPPMGGGIIDNKVDGTRIVTSGHSRGGEGVIVQYNQVANPNINGIRPPNGTLTGFDEDSFLGIHSIAEVTFLTEPQGSKTDDVPFLLYYGSSDADVCGCATSAQPTRHYNRAFGEKSMSYLYGAGHGFYNTLWSCVCAGPDLMTRDEVEAASAGYLLPWVMRVTYGNVPATDFFTRQASVFRPIGTEFVPDVKSMVNMYREAEAEQNFVFEDYELNANNENLSSSGEAVSHNLGQFFEGFFSDGDPEGGYSSGEPDGGFWWETNGAIGTWNSGTSKHYRWTLAAEERDLSDDAYLSFITCQAPGHRHSADDLDRDMLVVLIDGDGNESSINTLNYGGIEQEYDRVGGWGSAFATYRIRLSDFMNDGSPLDLKNVVAVEFRMGTGTASDTGRLGFDDLEIVHDD